VSCMAEHADTLICELRRAHALRMEFADGKIRTVNILTGRSALLSPPTVTFVASLSQPVPYSQAVSQMNQPAERSHAIIAKLVESTILHRVGSSEEMLDRDWANSWRFGAGAASLHFAFRPMMMCHDHLEWDSSVEPGVRSAEEADISLPHVATDSAVDAIMGARRSARRFTKAPVEKDSLGRILFSMVGVAGYIEGGAGGRYAVSRSPSAGALQPYEAYVIANRISGIPPGTYHYGRLDHVLTRIGHRPDNLPGVVDGQAWAAKAAFCVILAAIFERVWIKYATPAAYVNLLIEAGHRAQNGIITATDLGLAARMTSAIDESTVGDALCAPAWTRSCIYLLAFGKEGA
jgi:SagB-type dehydrogenase family enzyme